MASNIAIETDGPSLLKPSQKTAFSLDQYNSAYPDGFENHYRYKFRNKTFLHLIKRFYASANKILDIGCGRGQNVEFLRSQGHNVFGVELADSPVLPEVKNYVRSTFGFAEIPDSEALEYQCVTLLDVLEHIENPVDFLTSIHQKFKNLNTLIITVPAGPDFIIL